MTTEQKRWWRYAVFAVISGGDCRRVVQLPRLSSGRHARRGLCRGSGGNAGSDSRSGSSDRRGSRADARRRAARAARADHAHQRDDSDPDSNTRHQQWRCVGGANSGSRRLRLCRFRFHRSKWSSQPAVRFRRCRAFRRSNCRLCPRRNRQPRRSLIRLSRPSHPSCRKNQNPRCGNEARDSAGSSRRARGAHAERGAAENAAGDSARCPIKLLRRCRR